MSHEELDRLGVIRLVAGKRLRQREAGERLGVSVRQVKRLVKCYRDRGPDGLVSGHRGKRSNRAFAESMRRAMLNLIRERHADFGPTPASEKLLERHGCRASAETVRKWMIEEGLWQPRTRRRAQVHQRRPRRPRPGELIQVDGSPHDWFEGRSPPCTLIVFIDDATSRLMALQFVPAETTEACMEVLRDYLARYGRPVTICSDRHSIFRVNPAQCEGELTQFTRALKTLDIQGIHAQTPQAKGRVERANLTLQDRLVKELRLCEIDDAVQANAFLPRFMANCNARFAIEPQCPQDAHREVLHAECEPDLIFSLHHERTLSKNLTCRFENREYPIRTRGQGHTLRGARITVCKAFDGRVTLLRHGQELAYRVLQEGQAPTPIADEKSVRQAVEQAHAEQARRPKWKPPADHPWRRFSIRHPASPADGEAPDRLPGQVQGAPAGAP